MRAFLHDTRGITSVEYGLIVALIACMVVVGLRHVTSQTGSVADALSAQLTHGHDSHGRGVSVP